ncbi:hypothetical protein O6H91_19G026500 [Diphasiastrum complanatum]|uniref:Uncharacterized protein n=1 Tax=Diphasiastrum complanatum TaxID=34168 RepID=A0ACC2AUD4_DIPCM|nr:hypothetical protein O6H91_19G026500 [Diphasiastrum complanatum]
MGFLSFAGRVLFSAIFILASWQKINDFGQDGGGALKAIEPKFGTFKQLVATTLGYNLPKFELKYLLITTITLEGIGAILFTFGSNLGAYMLLLFLAAVTPIMHDFYNFDAASPEYSREFVHFMKNVSLAGALLFFLGMKTSYSRRPRRKSAKVKAT